MQQHIFKRVIWPEFHMPPTPQRPVMQYEIMKPGEVVALEGRTLEMIPVVLAVPAVGYRIACAGGVIAFSGDTSTNDSFWKGLNVHERLDVLIVETAFANDDHAISRQAKHKRPQHHTEDLKKLRHRPQIYITHN